MELGYKKRNLEHGIDPRTLRRIICRHVIIEKRNGMPPKKGVFERFTIFGACWRMGGGVLLRRY